MPVTIGEIKKHLDTLGVTYAAVQGEDSECAVPFTTRSYVDSDGDHSLLLIVRVDDDGQYLEIFAPNALSTANCRYKSALFSAMLQISLMTKHVQLEHDPADGEVRFAVDYPVCDGTVTAMQVDRMIRALVGIIEQYYPVLHDVMDTGKADWTKRWKPS